MLNRMSRFYMSLDTIGIASDWYYKNIDYVRQNRWSMFNNRVVDFQIWFDRVKIEHFFIPLNSFSFIETEADK